MDQRRASEQQKHNSQPEEGGGGRSSQQLTINRNQKQNSNQVTPNQVNRHEEIRESDSFEKMRESQENFFQQQNENKQQPTIDEINKYIRDQDALKLPITNSQVKQSNSPIKHIQDFDRMDSLKMNQKKQKKRGTLQVPKVPPNLLIKNVDSKTHNDFSSLDNRGTEPTTLGVTNYQRENQNIHNSSNRHEISYKSRSNGFGISETAKLPPLAQHIVASPHSDDMFEDVQVLPQSKYSVLPVSYKDIDKLDYKEKKSTAGENDEFPPQMNNIRHKSYSTTLNAGMNGVMGNEFYNLRMGNTAGAGQNHDSFHLKSNLQHQLVMQRNHSSNVNQHHMVQQHPQSFQHYNIHGLDLNLPQALPGLSFTRQLGSIGEESPSIVSPSDFQEDEQSAKILTSKFNGGNNSQTFGGPIRHMSDQKISGNHNKGASSGAALLNNQQKEGDQIYSPHFMGKAIPQGKEQKRQKKRRLSLNEIFSGLGAFGPKKVAKGIIQQQEEGIIYGQGSHFPKNQFDQLQEDAQSDLDLTNKQNQENNDNHKIDENIDSSLLITPPENSHSNNNDPQSYHVRFAAVDAQDTTANGKKQIGLLSVKNEDHEDGQGENWTGRSNSSANKQKKKADFNKKKTLKKQDLLITTFYMNDFGDGIFRKNSFRPNRTRCMLYPEDKSKVRWDLFMTLALMITCVLTPYQLAFGNDDNNLIELQVIDYILNVCFFFDIFVNFTSAYYDDDYNLIDDHKTIGKGYFYSWFFVDLISIIPFDIIFMYGNFGRMARIARLGKLYKIIRMARMVRMLKIVKDRNKLVKYLNEILKIGVGFERLMFMMLIFMVLQHIAACIWVFVARFTPGSKQNWIYQNGFHDYEDYELYVTSFYFTVTTIVTVGFGDIHAYSVGEKILCILLMLIGVISFSFATGSLSSIISNYDSSQAKLKEKIAVLNEIKFDYKIGPELYDDLMKTLKYDHSRNHKDLTQFLKELPYKLRIDLAMEIHKNIYHNINFFKAREKCFIAWIGPLLKPIRAQETEYIYKEGEEVKEIYFMIKGEAGYVLPRYDNVIYIRIEDGDHFGHVDIVFDWQARDLGVPLQVLRPEKYVITRKFTVQSVIPSELVILDVIELDKMKIEFPEIFEELFTNSYRRLDKELKLKYEAVERCKDALKNGRLLAETAATAAVQKATMNLFNKIPLINGSSDSESAVYNFMQLPQQDRIREYKEKTMKRTLTKGDVQSVAKFAQNHLTLKQIDEELEHVTSQSAIDGGVLASQERVQPPHVEEHSYDDDDCDDTLNDTQRQLINLKPVSKEPSSDRHPLQVKTIVDNDEPPMILLSPPKDSGEKLRKKFSNNFKDEGSFDKSHKTKSKELDEVANAEAAGFQNTQSPKVIQHMEIPVTKQENESKSGLRFDFQSRSLSPRENYSKQGSNKLEVRGILHHPHKSSTQVQNTPSKMPAESSQVQGQEQNNHLARQTTSPGPAKGSMFQLLMANQNENNGTGGAHPPHLSLQNTPLSAVFNLKGSSPSPDRQHATNTVRNQEERVFMNKFKNGFTKLIKKGAGGGSDPNEEQPEENKTGDQQQHLLNRGSFVDGKALVEQNAKTQETLEDLKVRMSKLEYMFSQILETVQTIGSEVKTIRQRQENVNISNYKVDSAGGGPNIQNKMSPAFRD